MSSVSRQNQQRLERFTRYWEDMLKEFPEARRSAVTAMGEAVRKEVRAQVGARGVTDESGHVSEWQELRIGSAGGYAAVSAKNVESPHKKRTYRGKTVSGAQVTAWLERGHGVPKLRKRRWAGYGPNGKIAGSKSYVDGFYFYSWTKQRATDIALKAADRVLCMFSDEH